jgi:hypothetical protein
MAEPARREARRIGLLLLAALVVLLHAVLLGGPDWASLGRGPEPAAATSMMVRNIDAAPEPVVDADPAPAVVVLPAPRPEPAPPRPRRPRAVSPSKEGSARPVASTQASASEPTPAQAPAEAPPEPSASVVAGADAVAAAASTASTNSTDAATQAARPASAASPPGPGASASFLAAGETPPPTYRTVLPSSVTLHYEVRRGFFHGTGEIRWQHVGDEYGIHLDARIAGVALLGQTSQGVIDATGLAPTRFLDQRIRRSAQAANFNRDAGTITFSGPSTVWPLLPGTQDQLSWMIQLAGIVAAEPERASEGGRISMAVVGARGDAGVRTLSFAGREDAQTVSGTVPALKFVAPARSTYDTSYEIWLDPAHSYLPVRATRRNGAGEVDFDLLLDRVEPGP